MCQESAGLVLPRHGTLAHMKYVLCLGSGVTYGHVQTLFKRVSFKERKNKVFILRLRSLLRDLQVRVQAFQDLPQ